MRILILSAAHRNKHALSEHVNEYIKRASRYCSGVRLEVLRDDDAVEERFRKAIEKAGVRARVFALEVEGKTFSSKGLAKRIEDAQHEGVTELVFLIGGSYGLPQSISKAAHEGLSLSGCVFTHQFVQLMLSEQIYRAFTIIRGEPYSH